jgi:cholesterol oxidase
MPEKLAFVLDIVRGYNALTGWARVRVRVKAAAATLGISDRMLSPREARLDGRPPSEDTLVFLMMGRDAADGQMRLTWPFRCFDVRWRKEASGALFDAMQRTTDELADAAQAKPYFALDAGPVGKFLTVHPLGGCPMGDDPATSVLDERGRAHGYDSLLVTDGSAVPTALGVNPSKTIAALAERSVKRLIDEGKP